METFERTVSYLFKNFRNRDAKAFTAQPAIKTPFPEPNITITSPSCGPSGSTFDIDHTQDGKDLFPELTWTSPSPETVEYLVVVQDVDVPIPVPITHGIYYSIPAETMSIGPESVIKEGEGGNLKGGFRLGANFRGTHWSGPRPLRGHGTHRYFFQVIALKEKLDVTKMSPLAKKTELLKEIEGKVVGWGNWVGIAERK